MEELKLHSFGQNDHLELLKNKYESLKKRIKGNEKLNEIEKTIALKNLTTSFEKEKKDSKNNVY